MDPNIQIKPPYIYSELLFSFSCWVVSNSFATPWTVDHQAPLSSMGFPRQQHGSGLPFPSPGDPPNPGRELGSPAWQADSFPSETPGKPIFRPKPTSKQPTKSKLSQAAPASLLSPGCWPLCTKGRFMMRETQIRFPVPTSLHTGIVFDLEEVISTHQSLSFLVKCPPYKIR